MPTQQSALSQNMNLLSQLFGSTSARATKGGGETKQTILSQEAVNAFLKQMMEDPTSGLAKVASGARIPGMYNTTTQSMMINDLMARSAAEVAKAGAPTKITKMGMKETTSTPGMLGSKDGLMNLAILGLGSKKGRELIGSAWDSFGGGSGGDSYDSMSWLGGIDLTASGDSAVSSLMEPVMGLTPDLGFGDIVGSYAESDGGSISDLISGIFGGSGIDSEDSGGSMSDFFSGLFGD